MKPIGSHAHGKLWVPLQVIIVLALVLSGCSGENPEAVGANSVENADLIDSQMELDRSMLMLPEDGWRKLAPGAWGRTIHYSDGGLRISHRATGVEGLRWLAEHVWLPRLAEIEAAVEAPPSSLLVDQSSLWAEHTRIYARLAVLAKWEAYEEDDLLENFNCVAEAAATAGPTTGALGAKASARARTCTTFESLARATVEPPFAQQISRAITGATAFADKVAYGEPCSSAADAYGYPEWADDYFHCP